MKLQEIDGRDDKFAEDSSSGGGIGTDEDALPPREPNIPVASRVPRTFDVELRGNHLVDKCIAGEVIVIVGELKMMQVHTYERENKRE